MEQRFESGVGAEGECIGNLDFVMTIVNRGVYLLEEGGKEQAGVFLVEVGFKTMEGGMVGGCLVQAVADEPANKHVVA